MKNTIKTIFAVLLFITGMALAFHDGYNFFINWWGFLALATGVFLGYEVGADHQKELNRYKDDTTK